MKKDIKSERPKGGTSEMSKLKELKELMKHNSIMNDFVIDITLDAFEKEVSAKERERIVEIILYYLGEIPNELYCKIYLDEQKQEVKEK